MKGKTFSLPAAAPVAKKTAGGDPIATRRLLGQLSRWCGLRQVIVFSGSQVVRDWAAAEATMGKVHLVEALDSGDDQFAPPTGAPTIDLSVSV